MQVAAVRVQQDEPRREEEDAREEPEDPAKTGQLRGVSLPLPQVLKHGLGCYCLRDRDTPHEEAVLKLAEGVQGDVQQSDH